MHNTNGPVSSFRRNAGIHLDARTGMTPPGGLTAIVLFVHVALYRRVRARVPSPDTLAMAIFFTSRHYARACPFHWKGAQPELLRRSGY